MAGSRFRRMANHARSPLTEQTHKGRSSKAKSFTTRRRTEVGGQKSEVSHRRQSQRLIDSRPRSSTLAGLPVDVSRLPPVPLSIFTVLLSLYFQIAPREQSSRPALRN